MYTGHRLERLRRDAGDSPHRSVLLLRHERRRWRVQAAHDPVTTRRRDGLRFCILTLRRRADALAIAAIRNHPRFTGTTYLSLRVSTADSELDGLSLIIIIYLIYGPRYVARILVFPSAKRVGHAVRLWLVARRNALWQHDLYGARFRLARRSKGRLQALFRSRLHNAIGTSASNCRLTDEARRSRHQTSSSSR